jgi:phage-related protein
MPGNVSAAVPIGVFPKMTYLSLEEGRQFLMLVNFYHNGESTRGLIVDGVNAPASIRSWKATARLKPSALATFRTFVEAHQGVPFYWYNPIEPAPGQPIGSNYDAAGTSTQGRHVCKLISQMWSETVDLARANTAFEFREAA